MLPTLLGGIGLFLLGMLLLTDGLQAAAGDALRRLLARFTRGPLAAVGTGMAFTAIVQSSSITTLATIGFVSAGLMTFTQSIGVIFGANLGTTVTSWLVSTIGLNVKLDAFALPVVGIGALLRMFSRGRLSHLGTVLAGFGLLFIGIETLQAAMADVGDTIALDRFIRDGVLGRLLLVLFGIVMTIVMQSSSAAVATTLTALHAGAIGLGDAAAVVVGQNVGTTAKAALGALGASLAARRTALAHIIFNLVTGVLAFLILPLFVFGVDVLADRLGNPSDAVSLAAFHTAFNLLGVALFLPFIGRFAALIERILPDRVEPLLWRLADVREAAPEIGLQAARLTLVDVRLQIVALIGRWRGGEFDARSLSDHVHPVFTALSGVRTFLGTLTVPETRKDEVLRLERTFHALEHLGRLADALGEQQHADLAARSDTLRALVESLDELLRRTEAGDADAVGAVSTRIAELRKALREDLLRTASRGAVSIDAAELRLSTSRWVDRVGYHIWRSLVHLHDDPDASTPEDTAQRDPDERSP